MPATNPESYGGATIRRRINRGDQPPLLAGETLTRADLMAMPISNFRALIDNRAIEPWPYRPPGEMHVVQVGKDRFHVFEGERLTAEPVTKDEAEALAADRAA
jgi:hypothetical protein